MTGRARIIAFGYPLVEAVTAYVVAQWIGWPWMLVLLLAGIPAGFAVMRNAGDAAVRDMARAQAGRLEGDPGRHAMAFVAGLLIAVPGFWTDLLGVLLLIPPTRRLFTRRAQRWLDSRFTTVRMPGVRYPGAAGGPWPGEVIEGTVVSSDDDDRADPTAR